MKLKYILCLAAPVIFLSGCVPDIQDHTPEAVPVYESTVTIGHDVTVNSIDPQLLLLDNKDALSANGLYYATWVSGSSVPYENSDGETVDLYDAQLYFLLSESKNADNAKDNVDSWISAAKANYDVYDDQEITCGSQTYTLLTYNCTGDDTPYDRGVSAFTVSGANAACIELTCVSDYDGDLTDMLTGFLENCDYDIN